MMSAREWAVTERSWAVVAGDGHPTYWIEMDPGLHLITGRTTVEMDTDVEESAYKMVPHTDPWTAGETVEAGTYRTYGEELYSCIQGHTTQSDWTPPVVPALWRHWPKAAPGADYPPWVQPLGAHDAYKIGDRVTHKDKNWECVAGDAAGNNVWEPGVYGWVVI